MSSCMHKFHGQWRHFLPNDLSGSAWFPGQMLVYCLGGYHWRMALLQDTDASFCREFSLTSPECQIHEARLRHDVHLTLRDGNTVLMEGLSQGKMTAMARLIINIQQRSQLKTPGESDVSCVRREGGKFVYRERGLGSRCLEGLDDLSKQGGQLTDVTLVAQDDVEFRCHRALLAATSSYFRAMLCGQFVETSKDKIRLSEISGPIMRAVLQYLYSGEVEISVDSVQPLFDAAHMLQLTELEKACVSYMLFSMTESNCVGVYVFASSFGKPDLKDSAMETICSKFIKITKASEFLNLEAQQAREILEMNRVQLCIEEDVYAAALRWLEFDMPARQEHMFRIMKTVRYVHMDECFFRERVKSRVMFRGCRPLQMLFEHVIYYMNHPYRWHELDLVMEPRGCRTACNKSSDIAPPRAVLYSAHGMGGITRLNLYTPERDTGSALTEWRNWPTECLEAPTMATVEAPSKGIYMAGGTRDGKLFIKLEPSCTVTEGSRRFPAADISNSCVWYKLNQLHHNRQQFSLVAVDRFLYAVGGCYKNTNLDTVEQYMAGRLQWVKVASLPCKLRSSCAVSFRGRLYVFGGESQTKKNRKRNLSPNVFCYDPETDRWSTLSPMKEGRALAGCAIYRGCVYVIGGVGRLGERWLQGDAAAPSVGEVGTCEMYDPTTDQWRDGPALPQTLAAPGVVKYMGTIYVMGGMQSGKPSRKVYRLSEAGDTWEPVPTDLYHPDTTSTDIHSCFLPISLPHVLLNNTGASDDDDDDSDTTGGTSMEHFNLDSTSHTSHSSSGDDDDDDILTGYPSGSWDTESSSSDF